MKRADKYPLIDPRLPRLYSRILEAANKMRAGQQAGVAILEAQRRAARVANAPVGSGGSVVSVI